MLYENEKSILATLITYPDLLPVFWDRGGSVGFFGGSECINAYKLICELAGDERLNWDNIIDYGFGEKRITATFICKLQDKRIEVPSIGFAEKHLTIRIDEIEKDRGAIEIHKVIGEKTTLNENDYLTIKEIAERRTETKGKKEEHSLRFAIAEYNEWKDVEKTGITTGFPTIDRYIGDINWGEVIAIMARTTVGKTFCAINIMQHFVLTRVQNIGFFSMEMSKSALAERIIQVFSGKNRNNIDGIDIKSTEDRFKDVNIYSKVYSVYEMENIIKRDHLKIAFIDFLQLIKGQGISLYEKTTNIIQDIKTLAKNLNIVIVVLVQLSRKAGEGAEEVRIDMARDSGAIEENSDFIIGLWNPEKKIKDKTLHKDARAMRLIKNKRGSTIGIHVHFNPNTGKMVEV